jgi:hypothetical protein
VPDAVAPRRWGLHWVEGNMKIRKAVLLSGLLLVACLGITLFTVIAEFKKEQRSARGLDDFDERMRLFQVQPTLKACARLLEESITYFDNYKESKQLYDSCVALGALNKPIGLHMNLWMAKLHKKHNHMEEARRHLATAVALDHENKIEKYGWIAEDNLQDIYAGLKK